MQCPLCKVEMVTKGLGPYNVEVCIHGCHSMWFDWFELIAIDEDYLKMKKEEQALSDDRYGKLDCPYCQTRMIVENNDSEKGAFFEVCADCGGVFVDSGDLEKIVMNNMSVLEAKKYLENVIKKNPQNIKDFILK